MIDTKNNASPGWYGFEYVGKSAEISIWENENYIPIGFIYDKYITLEKYEKTDKEYRDRLLLQGILLSDSQIEKYSEILTEYTASNIYLNSDMEAACDARREKTVNNFEYDSRGFKCDINLESKNLVFFSIPYEDGWTAYVNGKQVEIERVNVGFMAVLCEAGENNIEFKFMPVGLKTGVLLSGISIVIFAVYLIVFAVINKKKEPYELVYSKPAVIEKEESLTGCVNEIMKEIDVQKEENSDD